MKPTLSSLFPNASQSCQKVNPHIMGDMGNDLALGRGPTEKQKRGKMNKTEAEFALRLEAMKRNGEIVSFAYEAVKIKIGDGCWYVPDFFVVRKDKKPLFIEIKGFMRDDARVKFIAAGTIHKWADFEMYRKAKKEWTRVL